VGVERLQERHDAIELPARLEHADEFPSAGERIADVLQHREREDGVEAAGAERQSLADAANVRARVIADFEVDDVVEVIRAIAGAAIEDPTAWEAGDDRLGFVVVAVTADVLRGRNVELAAQFLRKEIVEQRSAFVRQGAIENRADAFELGRLAVEER